MSLATAIIEEDIRTVRAWLDRGVNVNEMDEYGFTPLIEAAIIDHYDIAKQLIDAGADVNGQDATGNTALHWATENNNLALVQLLLKHRANPNAYTLAGQPVLVMPILRRQMELKRLLYKAGANEVFAQDYINVKLLGHLFELVGTATILSPDHQFVEVDFEGFFLEITLGLICDSLAQFQNNYGSRRLRRYLGISQLLVEALERASRIVQFRQYRVDRRKHKETIFELVNKEPLILPIGYEGHAISFVKYGEILAKCDRREDSRLFDNIMCYRIHHKEVLTPDFLMHLLYDKQKSQFINHELHSLLGLEPLTEIKIESQISGNCSWANVEACIPTLFFLIAQDKSLSLSFFHRFREWNKDRALQFCLQSFKEANPVRKAHKAEILAAILFQRLMTGQITDKARIEAIMPVFLDSKYQYILNHYLKYYYYDRPTQEGEHFAKVLREYEIIKR